MPVICIGPVCVPLHLVLAFLVTLAHRYGYLTWFKAEWVTWRFLRRKAVEGWRRAFGTHAGAGEVEEASAAEQPKGPAKGQAENEGQRGAGGDGLAKPEGGAERQQKPEEQESTEEVLKSALREAKEAERTQGKVSGGQGKGTEK